MVGELVGWTTLVGESVGVSVLSVGAGVAFAFLDGRGVARIVGCTVVKVVGCTVARVVGCTLAAVGCAVISARDTS